MRDLLRICTAGSVDDGKSTLVGRLLCDTHAAYEDHVRSVRAATKSGAGAIDYALFTDGLKAEREQGITIDVAYRYFGTARRAFILADTPGHEQYTRNMVTGASTADVAVLLVDVQHGVVEQSRHHARIARVLGVSHFVLAVNKMDLVGFDRARFEDIRECFEDLLDGVRVQAIPVSALRGDNVIASSAHTPWYHGPSLLEHLETVHIDARGPTGAVRFPVQLVLRSNDSGRAYAGRIASGSMRVGDPVTVWPSGRVSRIERLTVWHESVSSASAPTTVTVALADDLDISRGDLIAGTDPLIARTIQADIVWMDERPLKPGQPYVLKHTTRSVVAEVDRRLVLNEIGRVVLRTSSPLYVDPYRDNRVTGAFVLIDSATSTTAGAGMVVAASDDEGCARRRDTTTAAARLARLAREAESDELALRAVERALEEFLI